MTTTHRADVRMDRAHARRRRLSLTVISLLVVAAVVAGVLAVRSFLVGPEDYVGSGTGSVEITIPEGASAARIGQILADSDVVASAAAFTDAAKAEPASRGIAPGTYAMALQMSGASAVDRLLDPQARVVGRVVVPEGSQVDDIISSITQATDITEAELQAVVADPVALPLPDYAAGQVEGFLYPATYEFDPDTTAVEALTAMVDRFNRSAREIELESRASQAGLEPLEVVTAASLVEAEVAPADFGKAARVVANRLEAGMRLQFDSTVNYAAGTSDIQLDQDQLALESPYNTYLVAGLPPGPIGSPSEAAMEAVLDPDDGDWLYFVSTDPANGITKFTASYEEFLRFKDEFQATLQ